MVTKIIRKTAVQAITFRPLVLAGVFILLLLIARLSAYATLLVSPKELLWLHLVFVAVGTLSQYAAAAVVIITLYAIGVKLFRMVQGAVAFSETDDDSELRGETGIRLQDKETGQVERSLQAITRTLAKVEQDRNAATLLLNDAQIQSALLISLIQGFAGKAEAYERQNAELEAAQAAITGGDPMTIAQAAGSVSDTHIRNLMLTDIADPGYWLNVNRVVAAQSGTLSQWSDGYKRFAGRLLLDFSKIKARLTELEAAGELVDVARPLAQLKGNLTVAGAQLQLNGRLGIETTGLLPRLE